MCALTHKLASGFSGANGCKHSRSGVSSRSRHDAQKRVRQCLKELRWGKQETRRVRRRGRAKEENCEDKGKEAGLEGLKEMKRGESLRAERGEQVVVSVCCDLLLPKTELIQ